MGRTLPASVGPSGAIASDGSSVYTWDPSGSVLAGTGTAGGGASGVLALADVHADLVGQFTAAGTAVSGSRAYDPFSLVPGADIFSGGEIGVGIADAGAGDAGAAHPDEPAAPKNCGESFSAGTLVLLAAGKTVPISSLKPGEKVLASDTRTGKNQPETVTAVMVHHDTDLYDLTVKTSHGTQVIHTRRNPSSLPHEC